MAGLDGQAGETGAGTASEYKGTTECGSISRGTMGDKRAAEKDNEIVSGGPLRAESIQTEDKTNDRSAEMEWEKEGYCYTRELCEIRRGIESMLANESNKVSKGVAKIIMQQYGKLEALTMQLTERTCRLEGRLSERKEIEKMIGNMATRKDEIGHKERVQETYAGKAKTPQKVIILKSTKEAEIKDSEELKKMIIDKVGRDGDSIKVRNIRKLKDKRVLVETETAQDLESFKEKVTRGGDIETRTPNRIKPRVILYDVANTMKEEELIEQLKNKNLSHLSEEDRKQVRIAYKTGPKGKEYAHVVLEVSGKVRGVLLERGRAFLGWNSHRVREWNKVSRCYRCQAFGHVANKCNREEACSHCGERGHKHEQCRKKEEEPRCANCKARGKTANHRVSSEECEEFRRASESLTARTDFT